MGVSRGGGGSGKNLYKLGFFFAGWGFFGKIWCQLGVFWLRKTVGGLVCTSSEGGGGAQAKGSQMEPVSSPPCTTMGLGVLVLFPKDLDLRNGLSVPLSCALLFGPSVEFLLCKLGLLCVVLNKTASSRSPTPVWAGLSLAPSSHLNVCPKTKALAPQRRWQKS